MDKNNKQKYFMRKNNTVSHNMQIEEKNNYALDI